MELKKAKHANLERKRGSILLLGMVCATSTTLMSFEYANYELKQEMNLMSSVETGIVWSPPQMEFIKPSTPKVQQEVSKSEFVEEDNEPEQEKFVEEEEEEQEETDNKFVLPDVPEGIGGPVTTTIIDTSDHVHPFADVMPEFPGGKDEMYKFMSTNITYPEQCQINGVQGKSYIQFTVEKDGSISDITIAKTPHKLLGKEASRVVKSMPNWTPGILNGVPVRVRFTLPVNFMLD
jgi:protein TonB